MVGRFFICLILLTTTAFSQINSWQSFQPFKFNFVNRLGGITPIFSVDLKTSIVPTVGDAGSHSRAATLYYFDTATTMSTVSSGNPAVGAYCPGNSITSGMYIGGKVTNRILQSEAPATTWTQVGTPTSVNNSQGTFVGNITYGTIVAAASGDGIQQSSADAAASQKRVASFWASTASGTESFDITLEGDSGGTPETSTRTILATTTPTRFHHYASFTASATGNIRFKITMNSAGTLRLGGMMLNLTGGTTQEPYLKSPVEYVKTTTGTAVAVVDDLNYPATNYDPLLGHYSVWICPEWEYSDFLAGVGPTLMGALGHGGDFLFHFLNGDYDFKYDVTQVASNNDMRIQRYRWTKLSISWDHAKPEYKIYRDGDLIDSGTNSVSAQSAQVIRIGNDEVLRPPDSAFSVYREAEIWAAPLGDNQETANFNSEKSTYRTTGNGIYDYGWPTAQTAESNVKAQFTFNEEWGSLWEKNEFGEVPVVGNPTFKVTPTGEDFEDLGPGISYSLGNYHNDPSPASTLLDPGSSDMVVEYWYQTDTVRNTAYIFDHSDGATGKGYRSWLQMGATDTIYFEVKAEDTTQLTFGCAVTADTANDDTPHKVRIKWGLAAGEAEIFFDGTSLCTTDITTMQTKTILANEISFGVRADGSNGTRLDGELYEWRLTVGNSTNNSGGPNGG